MMDFGLIVGLLVVAGVVYYFWSNRPSKKAVVEPQPKVEVKPQPKVASKKRKK